MKGRCTNALVIDDDVVDMEWGWMNADTVPHLTDFAI